MQANLELALLTVVLDTDFRSLPLVVKTALALVDYRAQLQQPLLLFNAAHTGDLEAALRRLPIFEMEKNWQQAVLALLAWCAVPHNLAAARRLRDRLAGEKIDEWPLPLFMERLTAALEGREPDLPAMIDKHPTEEVVSEIVKRVSGEEFHEGLLNEFMLNAGIHFKDPEMLLELTQELDGLHPDDAPVFYSQVDGPVLVAFARDYREQGAQYLNRYLDTHAENNYVFYRNLSLWFLFDSILRFPEQDRTLEFAIRMASIAMTGEHLVFRNALPYAFISWLASRGQSDRLAVFQSHAAETIAAARRSQAEGMNPYAVLHRQLAALAEAATLLPDANARIAEYFTAIENLGGGLAGFHAPAWLTLADSYRICLSAQPERAELALNQALQRARNINNSVLCVRTTARVNFFIHRVWGSAGSNLRIDQIIEEFCDNPLSATFSPVHIVGEVFTGRGTRPLPAVEKMKTLDQLEGLYQQPLADFLHLNPFWKKGDEIPDREQVRVPDPEFPPQLAAHFAASVLTTSNLTPVKRVEIIQRLVPIAAAKQTALDLVLARLLLAAAALPVQPAILDELAKIVPTPQVEPFIDLAPHSFPGPA
jgi:hypothetical protein